MESMVGGLHLDLDSASDVFFCERVPLADGDEVGVGGRAIGGSGRAGSRNCCNLMGMVEVEC